MRPSRPVLLKLLGLAASLWMLGGAMAADRNLQVGREAQTTEQRVALVIGNGAYASAPLKNPVNDAKAMAGKLKELGFQVTLKENLTQRGMVEAVRNFGNSLKEDGIGLFFFAGHGMQVKGRNFLIPVDADIQSEDEVGYMSLDANQVLDKMDRARSRVNVVVLDACRNNPFTRSFRSAASGLAQMDAPSGTLIAFATAPGSVASDGEGRNSTYTRHLLAQLDIPNQPVEIMFKRVREGVTRDTADKQTPWESSSLKGDFVFKVALADTEGEKRRQQAVIDQAVHDAVKRANEQAARERTETERSARETAERMIKEALERQRLALEQERKAREAQQAAGQGEAFTVELAFWDSIKHSDRPGDYRSYLKKFPNGQFAELAQSRLEALATPHTATVVPAVPQKPATAVAAPASPPILPSPKGFPAVGDTWTYRYADGWSPDNHKTVIHEVVAASEAGILERMRVPERDGGTSSEWAYTAEKAMASRVAGKFKKQEFAPYLTVFGELREGQAIESAEWFPDDGDPTSLVLKGKVTGREKITVPAGNFDAWRVELTGIRGLRYSAIHTHTIWYVPEIKRYVKYLRQVKPASSALGPGDKDTYELVSFKAASTPGVTQLALAAPSAVLAPALGPRSGDEWIYRIVDGWRGVDKGQVRFRVTGANATGIEEEARWGGMATMESRFGHHAEALIQPILGMDMLVFSPYLGMFQDMEPGEVGTIGPFTPEGETAAWNFSARVAGKESIQVPAGTFEAHRIELRGKRNILHVSTTSFHLAAQLEGTLWYAPAAKRWVRQKVETRNSSGKSLDKYLLELTHFTLH